jgi:toxin ParE1/3/4
MFGLTANQRHETLIAQALLDIAADPDRLGVRRRDDLRPGLRTYHLLDSRRPVRGASGAVRHPRHFVLFRISEPDAIDVARILHDSMDLTQHLPR